MLKAVVSSPVTSTRASSSIQRPETIEMRSMFFATGSPSLPHTHLNIEGDIDDEVETLQDETGLGIGKGVCVMLDCKLSSTVALDVYSALH